MNRLAALVAITLLWAAIYLPGLGIMELKGEEPRRALPAIAMLDTGDWVVPHLNGAPYLRKPPLVNWLIAASMKLTGERTELAARLPSVLLMWALALVLVWTGSRWLTPAGGFTAAVFVLASVAFVEKGRLAEIEADYVAVTGIAFAWWIAAWVRRESGWRLWLVPEIFLGLGLLTKGPTHLLFFYAVAIPILVAAKEQRQLWSWAHCVSLGLAVAIFLAWAVPYHFATAGLGAEGVWVDQMKGRVGGGSLHLSEWLPNLPRALGNGLPWILFAPLWWNRRVLDALGARDERLRILVKAARWPLAVGFAGLMLIPGMLPRYTLPLFPAAALLLALVASYAAPVWMRLWARANWVLCSIVLIAAVAAPWIAKPEVFRWGVAALQWSLFLPVLVLAGLVNRALKGEKSQPARLAAWSALATAAAMMLYSVAIMPRLRSREVLRPIGAAVNETVPPGESVYVLDLGYEPSLFYVSRPCIFVGSAEALPAAARYILVRNGGLKSLNERRGRRNFETTSLGVKGKKALFILKQSAESMKTPGSTTREAKL